MHSSFSHSSSAEVDQVSPDQFGLSPRQRQCWKQKEFWQDSTLAEQLPLPGLSLFCLSVPRPASVFLQLLRRGGEWCQITTQMDDDPTTRCHHLISIATFLLVYIQCQVAILAVSLCFVSPPPMRLTARRRTCQSFWNPFPSSSPVVC